MPGLPLTVAISDYDHVRDLVDGRVRPDGIDATYLTGMDVPEIFARFTSHREWEVSEFGLGKYAALVAQGDESLTAIPVFPSRMFRLTAFYVRSDSALRSAADLRGLRVGVPEWAQTACIYAKGWLGDDLGIGLDEIQWVQAGVDEPGRAEKVVISPPAGVTITPEPSKALSGMLQSGEIDVMLSAQPPREFGTGSVRRLLDEPQAVEADYFRRTGILPIMHTVAIRRDIYEAHPWIAANLFTAFEQAKRNAVARAFDWKVSRLPVVWGTHWAEEAAKLFPGEYWPYGVEENRAVLETFLRYCHEQGITPRRLTPDELFAPTTLKRVRV